MRPKTRNAAAIVAFCIVAACVFGIVHDLISTQACLEYFTIYHPRLVDSNDPIVLALVWGVAATWWMGAILGGGLAAAANAGPYRPAPARRLVAPIAIMLAVVLALSVGTWIVVHAVLESRGSKAIFAVENSFDRETNIRIVASLAAHNVSYFGSAFGALLVGMRLYRQRQSMG